MTHMRGLKRLPRITQRTSFVLLANAILRASGTLVFIIVGRVSGPEDAGVLGLSLGYLAILTTLFMGLDDLLIREVTAAPERVAELLSAYTVLRIPLAVLSSLVMVALGQTASQVTADQCFAMRLILASAVFDGFAGLGQIVLYSFGGFRHLLAPAGIILLLRAGVGSLLLVTGGFVPATIMWPISSFVGAVMLLFSAGRMIQGSGITRAHFVIQRLLVHRLAVLLPSFGAVSLLSALEYQLDVILLSALRAPVDVAMYTAAASVVSVAALIAQAYRVVLYPDLVRLHNESAARLHGLVLRAFLQMAALGIGIAAGITLGAPWLVKWIFGIDFTGAGQVARVLIWNLVFLFVNVPLVRYLIAVGQQRRVSGVLLISITVNLVANLLLISRLGAVGVAWARLASSAVFVAVIGGYVFRQLRRTQRIESLHIEVVK